MDEIDLKNAEDISTVRQRDDICIYISLYIYFFNQGYLFEASS